MDDRSDLIRRRWRTHKILWAVFAAAVMLWMFGVIHPWAGFALPLAFVWLLSSPYSFDEEFTGMDDLSFTAGGLLALAAPVIIIGLLIYFGLR